MAKATTRKRTTQSKGSKEKVLDVNTPSKISSLEKILTSGKITVVLIYADWCGHCHTFKKNVWSPMCEKEAKHNRVAVNEKVLNQTSLANAEIDGYPSVVVVNEKGTPEVFQKPDGSPTNAMPTPKSPEEMEQVVNMNVAPANTAVNTSMNTPTPLTLTPPTGSPPLLSANKTPQGTVYIPSPTIAPPEQQKGGKLMQLMEGGAGIGSLSVIARLFKQMVKHQRQKRKTAKQRKRRFIRA